MTRDLPRQILYRIVCLACLASLMSCSKGGIGSSGSSSNAGNLKIEIKSTYPTAEGSSWTAITRSNRYYIKGLDVTVEGTCSRGIGQIKVNEGGSFYAELAECKENGTFKWSKTYLSTTEEGDKSLTFVPFSGAGSALTEAATSLDVRIDNTAPAAPTVTSPASNPYSYNGVTNSYGIVGTVATDMETLFGPGGVSIPISAGWGYTATIVDGAATDFTFYGFDLAGNQSATTTQTITWNPTVSVLLAGTVPGSSFSDTTTNYKIEGSSADLPATSQDSGTGYEVQTGFNYISNRLRGQ
ncbi:MAG: hypothetical protein K2X47_08645 [Bdellovibrionales bacterium]|nr:hypothetical protein [Bdellovibrionales bacterium]